MFNFKAWWIKSNPAHDGYLKLHDHLATHYLMLYFHSDPIATQALSLKGRVVVCRWLKGFAAKSYRLCLPSQSMPMLWGASLSATDTRLKYHQVFCILWLKWQSRLHSCLDLLKSLLLLWDSLKTSSFESHLIYDQNNTLEWEVNYFQNAKRSSKLWMSFIMVEGPRFNNLLFTLEEIAQHASHK